MMLAAAMSPHGTSCRPGNNAIATGAVRARSVAVNVSAKRNSFQEKMKTKSPAAATLGSAGGRTTDHKARHGVHPSTRAAQYSSTGICRNAFVSTQITSGNAYVVWINNTATTVSRRPAARANKYSGLIVAI